MERKARFRELVLGIEGLALLRQATDGDEAFLRARVDEIREFVNKPSSGGGKPLDELDPAAGYATWASIYDSLPNAFIAVEQPVVHRLVERSPAGVALDAACGTGRHTGALVARGHRAIGVDQSPEMLSVARDKVPAAEFRAGDLEKLPVDDGSVDLALCALALTHLADLRPGVRELARTLRPGGRLIISDLHPMMVLLQGQAPFVSGPGRLAFVRNHVHLTGQYLTAFADAGLVVTSCTEPLFNGQLPPSGFEEQVAEAARAAWDGIPSVVVWELEKPL
ncbi:hypothetical protein GCM10010211_19500 [Streptomyces albospinus]|uniref:Methyltransferase type 11 domain-containing protein n=1 Tax=Streptomyces albospinus TaxID=285515 RepID=A0ABQ2UUP0_9ACTN|nr:class I SAM-dependent methyltransferase [Streptomyces albospinus]GGU54915.1 hypothetical protein GCM10010211_19500 [Streptomyces albospinus]